METIEAAALASTSATSYPKVPLRKGSNIITGPVTADFLFLESPSPPHSYRTSFRHPAYPDNSNVLLTLHAWDRPEGGIHYGLAQTACAIIANNRFDGYLSLTRDGSVRIEADWDACLPAHPNGYYFHVPGSALPDSENHHPSSDQDPQLRPYKWPFVPSFLDWQFPHNLPEQWKRCATVQVDSANTAQSDQAGAVQQRDIVCRVSRHSTSTEAAHLIPLHEMAWYNANSMSKYNNNTTLDASNLLRDPNNALLLRADLHKAFDDRKFVLFPKDDSGFVVHILQSAADLRLLYHNTRVTIPQCEVNYVFARFAWSIFPFITGFLTSSQKPRLVVQRDEVSEDWITREVSAQTLTKRSVASRSNSPTKRSRLASSIDEYIDSNSEDGIRGRKRNRDDREPVCDVTRQQVKVPRILSVDSRALTTPSMTEDGLNGGLAEGEGEEERGGEGVGEGGLPNMALSFEETGNGNSALNISNIGKLRQEALTRQRPPDYSLPPYERQRDAREELELDRKSVV